MVKSEENREGKRYETPMQILVLSVVYFVVKKSRLLEVILIIFALVFRLDTSLIVACVLMVILKNYYANFLTQIVIYHTRKTTIKNYLKFGLDSTNKEIAKEKILDFLSEPRVK